MVASPEARVVDRVVEALQRLGGLATLDELEGHMSRSGVLRLPPDALDLIVRATIRANRGGQGLGCFFQPTPRSVQLVSARRLMR
jgi:hypothetical protein